MIGPELPNPLMFSGGDPLDELGKIESSLRTRSSASAYLSRTPSSSGSVTTCTWSGWVKRGGLGSVSPVISVSPATNDKFVLRFTASNNLEVFSWRAGAYDWRKVTSASYADAAAWYHVVLVCDTTNATAEDRVRLYVNGIRVTVFSTNTNPSASYASGYLNSSLEHVLSADKNPAAYSDAYLAGVCFVDGQAIDVSAFGKFHPRTGQWRPKSRASIKAVVDAGGANSFFLPFDDATSLATLTTDASAKGNNWTATNVSLTAGITYDSMLDTPTNNFATLNPLLQSSTLSNANLVATVGTTYKVVPGSMAIDAQNADGVYWESVWTAGLSLQLGIVRVSTLVNPASNVNQTTAGWVMVRYDGAVYNEGAATNISTTFVNGDIVGFGLKAGSLYVFKNGIALNSGNPIATGKSGHWYPFWGNANSTGTASWSVNFGQFPFLSGASYYPAALGYFMYAPPAGFKSLCTKNLKYDASAAIVLTGTFTGNLASDGPVVSMNGCPETLTINGNAVTFGTHADRLASGFKVRNATASYNASGSNTWTATILSPSIKSLFRFQNARGNP